MPVPSMALLAATGGAAAFNPATSITWHSLFWAEGTEFAALGLADTNVVGTWPNETANADATQATASKKPAYVASCSALNNQPAVFWTQANAQGLSTATFSPAVTAPYTLVAIAERTTATGIGPRVLSQQDVLSVYAADANVWTMELGSSSNSASVANQTIGAKLQRVLADGSTGTDYLYVNETQRIATNVGAAKPTRLDLGGVRGDAYNRSWGGHIALIGIYLGDITADGQWSAFKTWITAHYGITLA